MPRCKKFKPVKRVTRREILKDLKDYHEEVTELVIESAESVLKSIELNFQLYLTQLDSLIEYTTVTTESLSVYDKIFKRLCKQAKSIEYQTKQIVAFREYALDSATAACRHCDGK